MTILEELEFIRKQSPDKALHPEKVVEFARSPNTALHAKFDWDDAHVAHLYRLWQARQIIRVNVKLLDRGDGQKVNIRAYVSLANEADGADGYIQTKVVLADQDKRRALIGAILNRISSILDLHPLPELDGIRQAVALTRAEHGMDKVEQVTESPPVQLESTT
ncbi:hypothetical protein [Bradyrhizobium lablabi]|uniref:hypothetical protein n=1 Tax=Bradyrhizobium lablabi TaxID=722472 RepID=UPI001BAB277B|nr:hypothetical protein [Bradyrhizobium lablabi]MBR0693608.1 hypothetical protein [Bradyrhizobium lablabi]